MLFVASASLCKSLLISTLDAYFSGRRELFRGLKMEALEDKW